MNLITMDYETYYGDGYTLSGKDMTTEAYVRDPRFEAILCSFKINDGPSFFVTRDLIPVWLDKLEIEKHAVLMHHAHFDALILNHHYGVRPKLILDTLGMARALYGANGRLSLEKLAERHGIGQKGKEVLNARGMRFKDFSPEALKRYGQYSCNDSDLTYKLGQIMIPQFSRMELQINDHIIRMFTEPVLELDTDMLQRYADGIRADKMAVMLEAGVQREDLMSNEKFASCLRELGIDPPMKISPTWLKKAPADRKGDGITYAFAKTDPAMQALQEHPDERVQILVEARLQNKTTIAEKGAERLIAMAGRGPATVYLKYSGASGTHRLSGGDKFNWQSMKRGSDLRNATVAPEGHKVVVGDSANIEARILDWLAGQQDMVQVYIDADNKVGPDMYCVMAERIYKKPVNKKDHPQERQMGKTCLAEGSLVLTPRGWIPIETILDTDQVWDGESWVYHSGLLPNGTKETLSLSGLWLTPDHRVWCATQWRESQYLEHDAATLSLALDFAAANLPLLDTYAVSGEVLSRSSCSVDAAGLNTGSTASILRTSRALDAEFAPMPQVQEKDTGCTTASCRTPRTVPDYLIDLVQLSVDAITRKTQTIRTMGREVSKYLMGGVTTAASFCGMSRPYQDGTILRSTWIGEKPMETMNQVTSGSLPDRRTPRTSVASQGLRRKLPVYDIACCGPKQRFLAMTSDGPVLVHNCKLGLGFGLGHERFVLGVRAQAKGPDGKPLIITLEFSKKVVDIYRDAHPQVKKLWKRGEDALKYIAAGVVGVDVDYQGIVKTCKDGLIMPGGLRILFPELKYEKDGGSVFGGEWTFWNGKAREHIYGAKLIENIVQCLARIIVFGQCLATATELRDSAKWVHSVHDEGVFVTPDFTAPYVLERLNANMRISPTWCASLPLNSEGGFHQRYGMAKS